VPYDNLENAGSVNQEMSADNLTTASYGSYYRLGEPNEPEIFNMILETAVRLHAPMIRVWGGTEGSGSLNAQNRDNIIKDALNIAAKAKKANIKISLEYHQNTITDTAESALDFIKEVRKKGGDNIYLYWQPNQNLPFDDNRKALEKICPYLSNVHVFAWEKAVRLPLCEHKEQWTNYINIIKNHSGENHDFLLEFVKDDSAVQMIEDSKILNELINFKGYI
jgi:sugar phosphate isomerase/epimerase